MRKSLLGLLISSAAYACQEAPVETVGFMTIEQGLFSQHNSSGKYIIKDNKAWETHYKMYHGEHVPNIDFSKEMVISVYRGSQPNPSYAVEIKEIKNLPGELEVIVEYGSPEPGMSYPLVIVQPYHLVKLQKTEKKIIWLQLSKEQK